MLGARMQMAAAGAGGGTTFPDDWSNYVEVTVQSSQVATDLTNFPVYVDLSTLPAGFFSSVRSDGGDIRVTKSDGTTLLPREVVAIDTGGSTGELHFKADSISSSADTTFRIYYGNAVATEPAFTDTNGRNAVWADYEAVYHMQEDPSGTAPQIIDSTGNGNDGTASGSMTAGDVVAGKLGQALDFDGSNDSIDTGISSLATPFRISVWCKPSRDTAEERAYGNFNSSADDLYLWNSSTNSEWRSVADGAGQVVVSGGAQSAGSWLMFAQRVKSDAHELYRNGALNDSGGGVSKTYNSGQNLKLGQLGDNTEYYQGLLDEVRIRGDVPSADWESAEYSNQNTPGTFYSVGSLTAT